jgi:uncharacterized protein (TIGR03118 family)
MPPNTPMNVTRLFLTALILGGVATAAYAQGVAPNRYQNAVLIANKASYNPTVAIEADFVSGWGLAKRPKGAGGHIWVSAKNTSYQYVGDVTASANASLHKLEIRDVPYVQLPVGGEDNASTGVVFNDSRENFIITQQVAGQTPVTAPAKFLFSSDGGIISAWTERKNPDGTWLRADHAEPVIDGSSQGAQFFGITLNADYSRLYAANFGTNPDLRVYDGKFQQLPITFDMPFDTNRNGRVDPGEYTPFNVQALTTPSGQNHIFVAYAKSQACPTEEVAKGTCEAGALFAGEEDTSRRGYGKLAEFTEDGRLVAVWNDGRNLLAPWGMTFAPANFGRLSGTLLVGNFGNGKIAAFNPTTRRFVDFVRDGTGAPLVIDKVWALMFGNGESLGDNNALYYAAAPNDEADGVFGSIRLMAR